MSKAEFLSELEKQMAHIPQLEKERILNYYNETIEDALEDGMSEEEIILSLGTMDEILSQIQIEHETSIRSSLPSVHKTNYLRYTLLFLSSPFWLTAIALIVTLYLCYITLILVNICLIVAVVLFFVTACFNIIPILFANVPSGLVLIGCMLVCLGSFPWIYYLLKRNLAFAKTLYQKGILTGQKYWRKVVA